MMATSFADLPSELLIYILSEACSDSGLTGCSLNLVSRGIRDLCLYTGVDIQCIALYGYHKMARFTEMLMTRDETARKVKHLFISDLPSQDDVADNLASMLSMGNHESPSGRGTLESLLQIIPPHYLQTLTIHIPRGPLSTPTHSIFSRQFHSLTELSLHAGLTRQFFEDFLPIPSLERLNIATYTVLPDDIGAAVTRIAPNLTHLRISLRTSRSYFSNIRDVIRNYVQDGSPPTPVLSKPRLTPLTSANSTGSSSSSSFTGMLPASLRTFIVTFNPIHKTGGRGLASRNMQYYEDIAWVKRSIPSTGSASSTWYGDGKQFIISDPPENVAEVENLILTPSLKVMYEEWEERIFDGEGCWKALVTRHHGK